MGCLEQQPGWRFHGRGRPCRHGRRPSSWPASREPQAPGGTSTLAHNLGFFPTSALIVGLELPDPNVGDGKTHIVMMVDGGFAASSIGLRFSEAFPTSRHSLFIANFLLAVDGDAAAQQELEDFFLTGDGAAAAFTPGGPFRHIISTIIVPEPAGLGLWASGLAALVLLRRRA